MVASFRIISLLCLLITFPCFGLTIVEKQHDEIFKKINTVKSIFEDKKTTISRVCNAIVQNPEWNKGGEYLFILDEEGTCLAFSNQTEIIWKGFAKYNDINDKPILDILFKQKELNNLSLNINNATMRVFFKIATKYNRRYAICCGFYPHNLEYLVIDLSNRVLDLISRKTMDRALPEINDPNGVFRIGDISLFIIDENGTIIAQPDNHALIGKNNFDPNFHTQKTIENFKKIFDSPEGEGWMTTDFRNAINKIWCKRYIDKKTQKKYLICTFYYPEISQDDVYSLVQRAIATIQAQGLKNALTTFNYATKSPDYPFSKGTISISVYSLDGICLANGENPEFVGENVLNRQDQLGNRPVKNLLEEIKQSKRSWSTQYSLGAYKLMYTEKVDVTEGSVIVTSGYWLHSKAQLAQDMVERGIDMMRRTSYETSVEQFLATNSNFLRGDVYITMLELDGYTVANGPNIKTSLWKKSGARDEHGRLIVNQILSLAGIGGGWISCKKDNAQYHAFVKQVESTNKAGFSKPYILLSGYYA